ncbi:EAL domain-containing protein [Marinimicrobium sp. C2-29]|uniref:EAL domain-containing protein n=1 Tax=Marinimicrobium sp. C2-29 TaxID=3139825 RepID=UPI00405347B9
MVVDDEHCGAPNRVNTLKALGVDISVDDFGTGYSLLSYLQGIPLDELKIEQSFLPSIANDRKKTAIF